MFTSLLSLYIASILQTDISFREDGNQPSIVKTASYDLSEIDQNAPVPLKNPDFVAPIIQAKSSLSMDLRTGLILFEDNAHQRLPIASLTKLMTTLIVLEENNLDDVVTISQKAATISGSTMFLKKDEKIELKNLIYGMLISSSNDAAIALAEFNAGSESAFVEKMNKKALALGLLNTHFANPVGLDGRDNYSSAYDLAKLSRYVYQKNLVKEIALVKEIKVYSLDGQITHNLDSTNELLDTKFIKIKGLKTGTTDSAGLCIISVAENDSNNEIMTVLLNSPDRFKETKILAEWTFRAYNWKK
jgi:D-alanyl-D-alanine carboxypeptidase